MIKEESKVLEDEFLQHYILQNRKVWNLRFLMLYLKFSCDNFSWFYRFKRTHIKWIISTWFRMDNSIFQMCLVDQIRKYGDFSFNFFHFSWYIIWLVCRTITIFLPVYRSSLNTYSDMLFYGHLTNRKFFRRTWKKRFDKKVGHFCIRDANDFDIPLWNICWFTKNPQGEFMKAILRCTCRMKLIWSALNTV